MRHILTAAAAIAVSGLLLSTAAVAQYQAGGPTQASGLCKVVTDTDADAYGYMAPCAPSAKATEAPGSSAYARAPGGNYEAGGPGRAGGMCKTVTDTDADAYGYMAPCK